MANQPLQCWKCGAPLPELPLPLSRSEECPACHADLRVCRLCEFYDPTVSRSCREPIADDVSDKGRANFCGYFKPLPDAYARHGNSQSAADAARAELETLFGLKKGD